MDGSNAVMRTPEEIRKALEEAGVDLTKPITTSCMAGVAATVTQAAIQSAVPEANVSVYDGSWSEYNARK
jgi:thiosulfate/3-mercaptopyruvate sulfurtransferase